MKMIDHHANSSCSKKGSKCTKPVYKEKKSSKKTKEVSKKSFKEILKNGLVICLDGFLLVVRTCIT